MSKWIIDREHSDVHFKARHLVIATVTGSFRRFEGSVEGSQDDLTNARVTFSAETDSVDTNNEKRDAHLKEDDFFNVKKFPKMHFESDTFRHISGDDYALTGKLTIKGVTLPIELKVVSGGGIKDAQGQDRMAFEVTGKLNRWDYGIMWNLLTEAGAIILGEEVKIHCNVQLVKVN